MTNYSVVTGEGAELTSGVSAAEVERVAQAYADLLGETVYYSIEGGVDLDPDDDEDIGTAVEPSCDQGDETMTSLFYRLSEAGTAVIFHVSGELVTRLDASVYPIGSDHSARYEHPAGIVLSVDDAERIGIRHEDAA